MDFGLKGKIALVAASSKGLGRACAQELAREGARVTICARNAEALHAARDAIAATGAEVLALTADMTNAADIERAVQETVARFGGLHIAVTNAGGRLIRAALPHMQKAKWGRIINITSLTVKEPIDNLVLSNSIRAAVHGLAKTLSNQLALDGITVNNVLPGYTQTDRMTQLAAVRAQSSGRAVDEVLAEMGKPIPMGRLGRPEEFAALVAFLASERASYITGESILVDGGVTRATFF
jgi:3-oxoacyl-[acyl-carrier protein] reductase